MMYILCGILIFSFLIISHEFGHFIAAKACHVKVLEFSVGMGPALLKKQGKETLYSLRLFPIGGYCAMEGEEENSSDSNALNNKGFWAKFVIYVSGALTNFLTGLLILLILYINSTAFVSPTIVGFAEGFDDSANSLMVNDKILKINNEKIYIFSDVSLLLNQSSDNIYDFVVLRNGEKIELYNQTLVYKEYISSDGNKYTGYGLYFGYEESTLPAILKMTWNNAIDFVRYVRLSFAQIFSGNASINDLSGPVGIVDAMTEVGEQSENISDAIMNILYLGALIAVNLSVVNMLPLPALDGGKVLFLLINAFAKCVFKREIPLKYESIIHFIGFALLLVLALIVTGSDILKLFNKG